MIAGHAPKTGANAERARSHNRQVVLDQIRRAGRVGRAEIAKVTGLSTQAVSNIVADLIGDDLVKERGYRSVKRGLPVTLYGLKPEGGYAFGAEVRPDAALATLLDLSGKPVFSERRVLAEADPVEVTAVVAQLLADAMEQAKGARLLGAGIVMPGPFGATGIRDSGSELTAWQDIEPTHWFTEALRLPVFVENDANAAAMAERVSGVAQGLDNYAFLYFGTGLGLGIVHQGRLVTGAFGNAGEIGHIPVPMNGDTVMLESAVSRLSAQRYLHRHGIAADSFQQLETLYTNRNPALTAWLTTAAEPLSAAITIIENLFDPQAIILGGAMPQTLLDHLIATVKLDSRTVSNRSERTQPRLIRGTSGPKTATLGAAALVINQVFTPKIAVAQ